MFALMCPFGLDLKVFPHYLVTQFLTFVDMPWRVIEKSKSLKKKLYIT